MSEKRVYEKQLEIITKALDQTTLNMKKDGFETGTIEHLIDQMKKEKERIFKE